MAPLQAPAWPPVLTSTHTDINSGLAAPGSRPGHWSEPRRSHLLALGQPAGHSCQPAPHHSHLTGSASPRPTGPSVSLSLPPPLPTLGTMVPDRLTSEAPGRMLVDCGPSDPKVSGDTICVHHKFRPGWSQWLLCVCVPCRPNILTFAKQKPWEVNTLAQPEALGWKARQFN